MLAILGVVASLGLELAIPICMADGECANLLALNGLVLAGTTTLVALFAWLVSTHMLGVLWIGSLADYRWLLPVGFACLGGYYIMVALATRSGAFKEIARTRISQGISGPVSQILLGLAGAGTPGLVAGYVIGQSSGTALPFSRLGCANAPGWSTSHGAALSRGDSQLSPSGCAWSGRWTGRWRLTTVVALAGCRVAVGGPLYRRRPSLAMSARYRSTSLRRR